MAAFVVNERVQGEHEFANWIVSFRDPREIYEEQPTYLGLEYVTYVLALLSLKHAARCGGRYLFLWFASILHGLTVESLSYFLPEHIDNFWHGQSSVIFLGGRLPLHIVLFYPVFYYNAAASVGKLNLKPWVEPFVTGLAVVLLDVPFDIMGIKLMWWVWHDTDPNIYDRHYWVPWTSYYFHATFAAAFAFIFHASHRYLAQGAGKWQYRGLGTELACTVVTGLFSMPGGILLFLPNYHPLHDNLGIHTKYCVFLLFAIYMVIIYFGWTTTEASVKPLLDELGILALIHYVFYILLVVFARPESQRSTGLHETVGSCNVTSPVYTAFGQVLSKRKYLCLSDYDEGYFDFHCTSEEPQEGDSWYTICGTPYPNHLEYVAVVGCFVALGATAYCYVHCRPDTNKVKEKSK